MSPVNDSRYLLDTTVNPNEPIIRLVAFMRALLIHSIGGPASSRQTLTTPASAMLRFRKHSKSSGRSDGRPRNRSIHLPARSEVAQRNNGSLIGLSLIR